MRDAALPSTLAAAPSGPSPVDVWTAERLRELVVSRAMTA